MFVFIIYLHDSYVLCDFKVRSDQNMSDKLVLLSGGGGGGLFQVKKGGWVFCGVLDKKI